MIARILRRCAVCHADIALDMNCAPGLSHAARFPVAGDAGDLADAGIVEHARERGHDVDAPPFDPPARPVGVLREAAGGVPLPVDAAGRGEGLRRVAPDVEDIVRAAAPRDQPRVVRGVPGVTTFPRTSVRSRRSRVAASSPPPSSKSGARRARRRRGRRGPRSRGARRRRRWRRGCACRRRRWPGRGVCASGRSAGPRPPAPRGRRTARHGAGWISRPARGAPSRMLSESALTGGWGR